MTTATKVSVPTSIRVLVSALIVLFIFITAMTGHYAIAEFAVVVCFGFPTLALIERIRSWIDTCNGEYSQKDLDALVVFELLPPFVCIWAERLPWYKWVLRKNDEQEALKRKLADTEWVKKTTEELMRILEQMERGVADTDVSMGYFPPAPHFTDEMTSILKVSQSPEWERLSSQVVKDLPRDFTIRLIEICFQRKKEEVIVVYAMEVAGMAIRRLLQENFGNIQPEIRQILDYWAMYGNTTSLGDNHLEELIDSLVKSKERLRELSLQEVLAKKCIQ